MRLNKNISQLQTTVDVPPKLKAAGIEERKGIHHIPEEKGMVSVFILENCDRLSEEIQARAGPIQNALRQQPKEQILGSTV